MSEAVTISRTEWNQFMKRFAYLEEYVKNSLKASGKTRWVTPEEAMELLNCGASTLQRLRNAGKLEWKHNGKGKGVMILRKSIEDFSFQNSNMARVN